MSFNPIIVGHSLAFLKALKSNFFVDHGYNPPPTWTVPGGALANLAGTGLGNKVGAWKKFWLENKERLLDESIQPFGEGCNHNAAQLPPAMKGRVDRGRAGLADRGAGSRAIGL